jgi:hypothetical protein
VLCSRSDEQRKSSAVVHVARAPRILRLDCKSTIVGSTATGASLEFKLQFVKGFDEYASAVVTPLGIVHI